MKFQLFSRQSGLTLLEMVIALSLVVLVLMATVGSIDQQSRIAEQLYAKLQITQSGVLRFQTDIPCGAAKLSGLVLREEAANGLCGGTNNLDRWRGPYTDSTSMYTTAGHMDLTPIIPGASMVITRTTVGTDIYTILRLNGITEEARSAVIVKCGDDCLPFKNLTNDEQTVGLLVSKTELQVLTNQTYEIAPLNVCRPGNAC